MSMCEICLKKIPSRVKIDGKIRKLKRKKCLKCKPFNTRSNQQSYTISELEEAVKTSYSKAEVIRKLNLVVGGANYKGIQKAIKENNFDTSHFTGQRHLKNKKHNWNVMKPLENILTKNSYFNTNHLKKRLIKEKILTYSCKICKLSTWLDQPISLHLDHINGINTDNRLENLRLLCPNCHSQTDTYCGKNK